jgi:hypothetical protein
MVGIPMATPLKVGGQRVRRVQDPGRIGVDQPRLPARCPRQPAEEVIEGA